MSTITITRKITARRTEDCTEYLSPEGAVIATKFDDRDSIIFDPMTDFAAIFCGEQEIANEDYFRAAGLI